VRNAAIRNRRIEELERRCHAGLSTSELATEVLRRLRTVMTIDAAFLSSVDPTTLLFTSATQEEPLAGAARLFLDNEFGQEDVNKFTVLAAATEPVRSLDDATQRRRGNSARYRDIMAPLGLGDELRAALRVDSTTWGVLCLHREDGPAGFSAGDAKVLARVAPHIAQGLRRATLLEAASGDTELGQPGVVVLKEDLSIEAVTPAAERLISEITAGWPHADQLPPPIYAVARRLLAFDEAAPPRLRLRTSTGRWLTLHAAHLNGDSSRIVVVVEPARGAEALPVMLLAHGLTSRESQIAQLVVRGYSTRQIVDQLHISRHTVQDHLKAVFDKTGVRSRRELVAQLLGGPHG
jgi:DNA-binding CsgD family transcriptional regulator/GAF domain-containing protein